MYKIISKSSSGMIELLNQSVDNDKATWFSVAPHCKKYIDRFNKGDVVEVESKKDGVKMVITHIKNILEFQKITLKTI